MVFARHTAEARGWKFALLSSPTIQDILTKQTIPTNLTNLMNKKIFAWILTWIRYGKNCTLCTFLREHWMSSWQVSTTCNKLILKEALVNYWECCCKPWLREGSRYQIVWIFGKIPNGVWPPPLSFWKIFIMYIVAFMQGSIGQILSVNINNIN